jgi:hypothetical protein
MLVKSCDIKKEEEEEEELRFRLQKQIKKKKVSTCSLQVLIFIEGMA